MQVRYLKSIIARVKLDYTSKMASFSLLRGQVDDSKYFDAVFSMQNPTQVQDGYDFDFENTGFGPPFQGNLGGTSADIGLYASKSAYDEMDCHLDSDFALFEPRLLYQTLSQRHYEDRLIELSSNIVR